MKNILILLFVVLLTNAYSHQDSYYKYKYDNVSVIIKTGYYYEEINNVKIIGQYAALLCKEIDYKQDIPLYFNHDYYPKDEQKNYIYLSHQKTPTFEVLDFRSEFSNNYDSILLNDKDKIIIQNSGFHFKIEETLELVYFACLNKRNLKHEIVSSSVFGDKIKSISEYTIDSIKNIQSIAIKNLIKNKVNISPKDERFSKSFLPVTYYSQNGKYVLIDNQEKAIDTLNQIFFLKRNIGFPDCIIVIESRSKLFIYTYDHLFNFNYKKSEAFNPKINLSDGIADLSLMALSTDILLIEFTDVIGIKNNNKLIYLPDEDILITDLMDFINSYRNK